MHLHLGLGEVPDHGGESGDCPQRHGGVRVRDSQPQQRLVQCHVTALDQSQLTSTRPASSAEIWNLGLLCAAAVTSRQHSRRRVGELKIVDGQMVLFWSPIVSG